jgi:hypothetical protein
LNVVPRVETAFMFFLRGEPSQYKTTVHGRQAYTNSMTRRW